MPGPDFLDTDILVYAYDPTDRRKQGIAQALLYKAMTGEALLSTQVLAEFAATLLHKLKPPAKTGELQRVLDALGPIPVIAPNEDIVRRAVDAHGKYEVHFYDGMVIAAAEAGGCAAILSEDLNHGQEYFGVRAINPFR